MSCCLSLVFVMCLLLVVVWRVLIDACLVVVGRVLRSVFGGLFCVVCCLLHMCCSLFFFCCLVCLVVVVCCLLFVVCGLLMFCVLCVVCSLLRVVRCL